MLTNNPVTTDAMTRWINPTTKTGMTIIFFFSFLVIYTAWDAVGLTPGNKLLISLQSVKPGHAQVYFSDDGRFTEASSARFRLMPRHLEMVTIPLAAIPKMIRVDPAETDTEVLLASIEIRQGYRSMKLSPQLIAASATRFNLVKSSTVTAEGYILKTLGNDPSFVLPIPALEGLPPSLVKAIGSLILGVLLGLAILLNLRKDELSDLTRARLQALYMPAKFFLLTVLIGLFSASSYPFGQPQPFCCDAEQYWNLSQSFAVDGNFSIAHFDNALRGYSFPFLLLSLRLAATKFGVSEFAILQVGMAILWSVFCVLVVPTFSRRIFGQTFGFVAIAIFAFLMHFFWRGFLLYPMPDVLCVIALIGGIVLCLPGRDGKPFWIEATVIVVAGALIGLAMNMRPVYELSPLLLVAAIAFRQSLPVKRKAVLVSLFLVGMWLPQMPQQIINRKHFDTASPLVQTKAAYEGKVSLYALQLFFGIPVQRHECGVYLDQAGIALSEHVISKSVTKQNDNVSFRFYRSGTISQYLTLVGSYPLEFLGLYARHLVNGIAVLRDNIYRCDTSAIKFLTGSFFVWAVGALAVVWAWSNIRTEWRTSLFLAAPAAAALVAIPTAIDSRYFLPVHMLMYMLTAMALTNRIFFVFLRKRLLSIGLLTGFALAAYSGQVSELAAALHVPIGPMNGTEWLLTPAEQFLGW